MQTKRTNTILRTAKANGFLHALLTNSTHTQITHKLSLPPTNYTPLTIQKTRVTSIITP